jgi:site-specific recombinase XerD
MSAPTWIRHPEQRRVIEAAVLLAGLLVATGLRISEALALDDAGLTSRDVNDVVRPADAEPPTPARRSRLP